jgi:hypothetical protein
MSIVQTELMWLLTDGVPPYTPRQLEEATNGSSRPFPARSRGSSMKGGPGDRAAKSLPDALETPQKPG